MSGTMGPEWGREREIPALAADAARALLSALALVAQLAVALLRPAVRVLRPAVSRLAAASWAAFSAQPPRAIALQLVGLLLLIALLLLEHRFGFLRAAVRALRAAKQATRARYRAVLAAVARQSRIAAAATPHAIFLAGALACERAAAPAVGTPLRAAALLLAACVVPVARTVRQIYGVDVSGPDIDTPLPPARPPAAATTAAAAASDADASRAARPPVQPNGRVKSRRLSTLRRRAAVVAEQIERDGEEGAADDTDAKQGAAAAAATSPVSPETPPPAARTLPATGLARVRRPRTAFTDADERAVRRKAETELLQLWVVAALVVSLRSVMRFVCPGVLSRLLDRADGALFYFFVWMQAGFTKGARVVYRAASAVIGKGGAREPDDKAARLAHEARGQRVNIALRLAVALGLVSQERADDIGSTVAESGVALVGVLFFFTPGFLTFAGTVLVAMLAPAYLSAATLQIVSGAAATRRNWLTYWAVFAVVQAVWEVAGLYLGWLPLWYHVKMAVVLWLQLPYYRGAAIVLHHGLHGVSAVMTKVTRTTYTPRKLKLQ